MKTLGILLVFAVVVIAVRAQNITSGLIAHYPFEGSPNDVSGNGSNGTPGGLFQYASNGLTGSALRISGDNSLFYSGGGHVLLPTFSTALNSGFTVSLWVKDEVLGGDPNQEETYISFGIVDQPTFGISLNSVTRRILYYMNNGSGGVAKDIPKPLNFAADLASWKHLVLTYTPGKMAAYFNGTKVGEQLIAVNVFPVTRAGLGRHWWSGGAGSSARMSVTLDNVRVYSRTLTDADVQQLYATETSPPSPTPTITSQPVSQAVIEQQSTTFRVVAGSNSPLLFQWRKNDVPILGAVDATYTISAVSTSDAGSYSVAVTNAGGTVVSAIATLSVVPANPGRFSNLSTLGSGGFTMGFVVSGATPKIVLIRSVGPGLRGFGIATAASNTALTLYSGVSLIGSNTGWGSAPNAAQIAAVGGPFPLQPGSADSAILAALSPGNYSAQVTANGAALVEVYEVP
jgi:hypothetical protein